MPDTELMSLISRGSFPEAREAIAYAKHAGKQGKISKDSLQGISLSAAIREALKRQTAEGGMPAQNP